MSPLGGSSVSESPLFTFGAHPIAHVPRQWERAASSPRKRQQRKGTKVWKRQAPPQSQDALVSAQLLNDLADSLSKHAAKRQRTQHMPAVPSAMQTQAPYAPTLSDAPNSVLKRKPAGRRKSNRGTIEQVSEGVWLSPTKRITRRWSSTKPTDQESESIRPAGEPEYADDGPDLPAEVSFLDAIDLKGSTMFDTESPDDVIESEAESEDPTVEFEGSDDNDGGIGLEVDDDEPSEDSEDNEITARLADAGNTGVVRVGELNSDEPEEEPGSPTATEDLDRSVVQGHVAELLKTPPRDAQAAADEKSAIPSPATEDEALKSTSSSDRESQDNVVPSLEREDTDSTVAFDDPHVPGLIFGTEPAGLQPPEQFRADGPKSRSPRKSVTFASEESDSQEHGLEVQNTGYTDSRAESKQDDEDSDDELYGGSPTLRRIFLSPNKQTASKTPSPKKTRGGPRLSDDTTYLNDFLSRFRSQAAARSQESIQSPVKAATPRRSPRIVLGELDTNSPSPSSNGLISKSPTKEKTKSKNDDGKATGSPVKMPKTPAARVLLSSNLESPDTPDELVGVPPGSAEDAPITRRSGRPRLPAPSRLPLNAPSNIPLRRADGDPPVLQKSEAQVLARTTAANTRRNKGGARFPKQVIEILESRELSPVKSRGVVKNRKGQNVDWDHRLVYFLEDTGKEVEIDAEGRLIEKENGKEVKRKVRIVKGEKVVDDEDESDEEPPSAESAEKEPVVEQKASKAAPKAPRRAKAVSTKASGLQASKSAPNGAANETKSAAAKPKRAKAPTTIGLKGTPAVKRMLSIEAATPALPAAKRKARKV